MLLQREQLAEANEALRIAVTTGDRERNVGRLEYLAVMLVRQGAIPAARLAYAHVASTDLPEFAPAARARIAEFDRVLGLASGWTLPTPVKRRWWRRGGE